jgi:hypothetical protein
MSACRDVVSERLALGAGVWLVALAIGCGSSHASPAGTGGTAGAAPDGSMAACPMTAPGEKVSGVNDGCSPCPGLACSPTDRCESEFHRGGAGHTVCACVDGHMGCCSTFPGYEAVMPGCDYGPFTAPACPPTAPADGDSCGPAPNHCRYTDGAAFACLCDIGDGGAPTWHCGPDV